MATTFPTSVKSFTRYDQDLDKDIAIRTSMDDVQNEVEAIETALIGLGSTALTATGVEVNNHCDIDTLQALTDDGAITIKNGIVTLNKAGVIAATLAAPAATDNGKVLTVYSLTAQAHTVTVTGSAGGEGADVYTFGGAIGDAVTFRAYGSKWYAMGVHGVTGA